ncbi:MAG: PadR family transcriptional regulator [Nonomuraea sp.]|nr:PadR family transcriptional regulator [Nonomuraea sp.]
MGKRRPVENLLALAVLSAVVLRPMHPYEMASVLRARGKDDDMPIKWGSLYTVVRNLDRHGLIEAVGSAKEGGRPERTIYRITEEGVAELRDWARELLAAPQRELPRFKAGLSVLGILGPDEVLTLLRERLEILNAQIGVQSDGLERDLGNLPRLFLLEEEYELAVRRAEAAWVAALVQELDGGAFPGLEQWREYHDTGQVPEDLAGR